MCQCDQSRAPSCTAPQAHKQRLSTQHLFTRTSKPLQGVKFHQDSKVEPKRRIKAGMANTRCTCRGSSQIPPLVLFGPIDRAHPSAEGRSSHGRDSLPSPPVVTELSRCTGVEAGNPERRLLPLKPPAPSPAALRPQPGQQAVRARLLGPNLPFWVYQLRVSLACLRSARKPENLPA